MGGGLMAERGGDLDGGMSLAVSLWKISKLDVDLAQLVKAH